MLTDMEILEGYNIPCLVVQKMAKSKKLVGEYAMLVGWFVVNTIKSLINVKDYDLFLPCDIMYFGLNATDLNTPSDRLSSEILAETSKPAS